MKASGISGTTNDEQVVSFMYGDIIKKSFVLNCILNILKVDYLPITFLATLVSMYNVTLNFVIEMRSVLRKFIARFFNFMVSSIDPLKRLFGQL